MTKKFTNILIYMIIGLHLAVIQYAYFFLLEAYLSSRSVTYFISLFFWLCGFLIGLNLPKKNLLLPLIALGLFSYLLSYFMHELFPYRDFLYPVIACTISVSSLQSGYFFNIVSDSNDKVQTALVHENNGFVLGTLLCMLAVLYVGWYFLAFGPTASSCVAILVAKNWNVVTSK